jgi:rhodanese-related sulfurtransferase
MKSFQNLIADCLVTVEELYPWDLQSLLETQTPPLLLDIREPYEFDAFYIKDSLHVPRGILETACEYGYEETVPVLVEARDKSIVVICRSGNRSVLAAYTMYLMGYQSVKSLKTGIKGWNDFELPLQNSKGEIMDVDEVDALLMPRLRPDQMPPKKAKRQVSSLAV